MGTIRAFHRRIESLGPPHLINRFVQVFGNMKLIMHKLGLGTLYSYKSIRRARVSELTKKVQNFAYPLVLSCKRVSDESERRGPSCQD
jgi:hypothetical protein